MDKILKYIFYSDTKTREVLVTSDNKCILLENANKLMEISYQLIEILIYCEYLIPSTGSENGICYISIEYNFLPIKPIGDISDLIILPYNKMKQFERSQKLKKLGI